MNHHDLTPHQARLLALVDLKLIFDYLSSYNKINLQCYKCLLIRNFLRLFQKVCFTNTIQSTHSFVISKVYREFNGVPLVSLFLVTEIFQGDQRKTFDNFAQKCICRKLNKKVLNKKQWVSESTLACGVFWKLAEFFGMYINVDTKNYGTSHTPIAFYTVFFFCIFIAGSTIFTFASRNCSRYCLFFLVIYYERCWLIFL